jgi:predicted Ser/Thr protein kinase
LSVKLDSITKTHLFGTDDDIITDNEFLKILKDRIEKNLIFDEEEDEDDDLCLTNKVKELSLDNILDKISNSGLSSLSEYEKNLLNEYSK